MLGGVGAGEREDGGVGDGGEGGDNGGGNGVASKGGKECTRDCLLLMN